VRPHRRIHRRERSPVLEVLEPLACVATTIDFGRVTYEDDFQRALATGGVELLELVALDQGRQRASMLVVARPMATRG